MPELPEVETARRILALALAGQTIENAEVCNAQIVAHPDAETFASALRTQTIADLSRRGKFLTLRFDSGDRLVLHLRMTGQPLVVSGGTPVEKHTHLILTLSNGNHFRYIDPRRFGRFWFFRAGEADTLSGQAKLGLEPTEPYLTADYLHAKAGKRKTAIKEALLNQTVVAGIGNIYADEILFAAGLYPGLPCDALSASDWARLAAKIPEIIRWGIEVNQMTPEEYLRGKGRDYRNMTELRVYGRSGQRCAVCQSVIEKTTIGGRSSCYCPCCQRISK